MYLKGKIEKFSGLSIPICPFTSGSYCLNHNNPTYLFCNFFPKQLSFPLRIYLSIIYTNIDRLCPCFTI